MYYYSCAGAPTGQTLAQFPQSMQADESITYISPSLMQLTGHSAAHAPQAMHASLILNAIVVHPPYITLH